MRLTTISCTLGITNGRTRKFIGEYQPLDCQPYICDLDYLRNWSLVFDLQIIARTVRLVFFDRKAY